LTIERKPSKREKRKSIHDFSQGTLDRRKVLKPEEPDLGRMRPKIKRCQNGIAGSARKKREGDVKSEMNRREKGATLLPGGDPTTFTSIWFQG